MKHYVVLVYGKSTSIEKYAESESEMLQLYNQTMIHFADDEDRTIEVWTTTGQFNPRYGYEMIEQLI